MKSESMEWVPKVVLLGASGVGKSTLLLRLMGDTGVPEPTVGVSFCMLDGAHIWDTSGHARFETLVAKTAHDAHIALLVCDPAQPASVESLPQWAALAPAAACCVVARSPSDDVAAFALSRGMRYCHPPELQAVLDEMLAELEPTSGPFAEPRSKCCF